MTAAEESTTYGLSTRSPACVRPVRPSSPLSVSSSSSIYACNDDDHQMDVHGHASLFDFRTTVSYVCTKINTMTRNNSEVEHVRNTLKYESEARSFIRAY